MAYQQQQQIPGSSSTYTYQSPFGDTTFTKVFVGGLAWETNSDALRRHFEPYGDILEAVVITDKYTGRSKGYGFVTFRDPESARRACADPTPVIDGRRANCNLASLGRPRPPPPPLLPPPYGRIRASPPIIGGVQSARGPFVGNFGYQQPLSYHQGVMYPPYGYAAYGSEYAYPQGVYNPYLGQQYLQMYGVPGTVSSAFYPYGQLGQTVSGTHGYTSVQGYGMPSHQMVQFGGPSVNPVTSAAVPTMLGPYSAGIATPVAAQPQFIVPASPRYIQGSGSEQTAG